MINRTHKAFLSFILIILTALLSLTVTFAVVLFSFKVDNSANIGTDTIDSSVISMETTTDNLSFSKAGEKKDITIKVKNKSSVNTIYDFELSMIDDIKEVSSAILVYLDNNFLGSLASLCSKGTAKISNQNFVMEKDEDGDEHTLTFELHIAAPSNYLNQNVKIKINSYLKNADYRKYIFVSNEDEFGKAIADINSGLLRNKNNELIKQTIVLSKDVRLTATYDDIKYPFDINLNGNELILDGSLGYTGEGEYQIYSSKHFQKDTLTASTGKIILNNEKGYLNILDFYYYQDNNKTNIGNLYSDKVEVKKFSKDEAINLIKNRFMNSIKDGILSDTSVSLFGALSFYANNITVTKVGDAYTYTNGILKVNKQEITSVEVIKIEDLDVNFKIIGDGDDAIFASILANELKHIPNATNTDAVVTDIFLPEYIESKNARIVWHSSDLSSISDDGRLADTLKENTEITLFADIYINNSSYTTKFTFKVTSQTKETKFHYLIASLSPIKLKEVYKESENNQDKTFLYLPIVSSNSQHDYRKSYTSPNSSPTLDWNAFKDIGLKKITYTLQNAYNFISINNSQDEYAVYLNSATFYTFAQIDVVGDFGGGETYSSTVNIIIELGANSELYELAFSYVEKQLNEINILQNILDTRLKYGMKNERGDFYLEPKYQTINIKYTLENTDNDGAITAIKEENDKFHVYIDASKFSSAESSLGIKVQLNIEGDETGQSRIMFFKAPGVIKPDSDGFANYSVFNSIKYQVYMQLPNDEKTQTDLDDKVIERLAKLPEITARYNTGFAISNGTITNTTGAYILIRDTETCSTLTLIVDDDTLKGGESNTIVYDFSRLLAWATSVQKENLPFSFSGYSTNTLSNGKTYMSEEEVAVLKTYLKDIVNLNDEEIEELWSKVTKTATGRIIDDNETLSKKAIETAGKTTDKGQMYFKYVEVMQWALNEKNFDPPTSSYEKGVPPDLGQIGNNNIKMNSKNTDDNSLDWSLSPSSWTITYVGNWRKSKYCKKPYIEDDLETISDYEAQCIMAFWFGCSYSTSYNSTTVGREFATTFISCTVLPTYLNEDGAGILINTIYKKISDASNFTSTIKNNVPYITNMDGSFTAIGNFKNLTSIEVKGYNNGSSLILPAFLSSASVNGFFNRLTSMDEAKTTNKLTTFKMSGCSDESMSFDITNLYRLTEVNTLDFSYNMGISNIGSLLDIDITAINYLDIYKVNVTGEFVSYPLLNIKVKNPSSELWYGTNSGIRTEYKTNEKTVSDALRYLNEIGKIESKYLLLCKQVSTSSTSTSTIIWYVEEGNPGYLISYAGNQLYSEIDDLEEMNKLLTNYYYATTSFTDNEGNTFDENSIYKISYSTTSGKFTMTKIDLTISGKFSSLDEIKNYEYFTEEEKQETNVFKDVTTDDVVDSNTQVESTTVETGSMTIYFYKNNSDYKHQASVNVYSFEKVTSVKTTEKYRYATYKSASLNKSLMFYYNGNGEDNILANSIVQATYTYAKIQNYQYWDYEYVDETTYSSNDGYSRYRYKKNATDESYVWLDEEYSSYSYFSTSAASWWYTPTKYNYKNYASRSTTSKYYTFNNSTYQTKSLLLSAFENLTPTGTVSDTVTENVDINTYISNVTSVSSSLDTKNAYDKLSTVLEGNTYYRYLGNSGSINYYDRSLTGTSKTYNYGNYYRLEFTTTSGYILRNITDTTIFTNALNDYNMENILAVANLHKDDELMGNYYGNYYCYNGETMTVNKHVYTKGYVYRLLLNADGEFYFEHDALPNARKTFEVIIGVKNMLTSLVENYMNQESIGKIVYLNGYDDRNMTYANGLYELTYNILTSTYYFKTMGDLGNNSLQPSNYDTYDIERIDGQDLHKTTDNAPSRFKNIRYHDMNAAGSVFYGGTGGSRDVIIVARVIDNGTIYERKFKVTVSA